MANHQTSLLISDKVNSAINQQIGNEFGAFLQYIAIASHFAIEGLPELSRHFYHQADEERTHAMKFVKYVVEAGGHVAIPTIPSPKSTFKSVEEAIQLSLEWEQTVTKQINALLDLAIQETDRATENFLQWFIAEQFEEVSSMQRLLKIVQRAGENGLIYIETHLARETALPVEDGTNKDT